MNNINNIKVKQIKKWAGEFSWLDIKYPCQINYGGVENPTLLHAFEAARTRNYSVKEKIAKAKFSEINDLLKGGDPNTSFSASTVMRDLLEIKFGITQRYNSDGPMFLFKKLVATGQADLLFNNEGHDNFWGNCTCGKKEMGCHEKGKNMLGYAIMDIRSRAHDKIKVYSDNLKLCHCGNVVSKRILYSVGWIPKLKYTCSNSECIGLAVSEAIKHSSDRFVLDYTNNKFSSLTYNIPKAQIKEVSTVNKDDLTDDEVEDSWHLVAHMMGAQYSIVTPEREYQTIEIQC